ncbi:hypothetical protein [Haloarchaeobius sp. HRN-SO-5]|uniref:hypothetical protein n=1 Tax=Haloarchaeobius sp. HRN-SO-5 TaxID=3446118 RepID=UPI003EBC6EE6
MSKSTIAVAFLALVAGVTAGAVLPVVSPLADDNGPYNSRITSAEIVESGCRDRFEPRQWDLQSTGDDTYVATGVLNASSPDAKLSADVWTTTPNGTAVGGHVLSVSTLATAESDGCRGAIRYRVTFEVENGATPDGEYVALVHDGRAVSCRGSAWNGQDSGCGALMGPLEEDPVTVAPS